MSLADIWICLEQLMAVVFVFVFSVLTISKIQKQISKYGSRSGALEIIISVLFAF